MNSDVGHPGHEGWVNVTHWSRVPCGKTVVGRFSAAGGGQLLAKYSFEGMLGSTSSGLEHRPVHRGV